MNGLIAMFALLGLGLAGLLVLRSLQVHRPEPNTNPGFESRLDERRLLHQSSRAIPSRLLLGELKPALVDGAPVNVPRPRFRRVVYLTGEG